MMMTTDGVALFGGMFNPVHLGHLLIASGAAEEHGLKTVHFLPARIPPHKPYRQEIPDALRVEMLQSAIGDDPRFSMLDMELNRASVSYTINTVDTLRAGGMTGRLYFIIGDDLLDGLASWKDIDRLKQELHFLIAPRDRAGVVPIPKRLPEGITASF